MLRGVEPLELSARRFVALIKYYLREGLAGEELKKMDAVIEEAGKVQHPWLTPAQLAGGPEAPKPPPGWLSEEQNWAGIQGFLGQMGTVKGAVSREKVK